MARQRGILMLEGRVGEFTFVNGRNGFFVRSSRGVSGKRVLTDPAFTRTRENGAEFGHACKSGKLLRQAFHDLLFGVGDPRVTGRLAAQMLKVAKSDVTNERGRRSVAHGDISMLDGFEFNINAPLDQVFHANIRAGIDSGQMSGEVMIPAFHPWRHFSVPGGATHYQFKIGIASFDFASMESSQAMTISEPFTLDDEERPGELLAISLPPETEFHRLVLVFGVEFIQIVNGKRYSLHHAGRNALKVVGVRIAARAYDI